MGRKSKKNKTKIPGSESNESKSVFSKARPRTSKDRCCLRCDKIFTPESRFNFMCSTCRSYATAHEGY